MIRLLAYRRQGDATEQEREGQGACATQGGNVDDLAVVELVRAHVTTRDAVAVGVERPGYPALIGRGALGVECSLERGAARQKSVRHRRAAVVGQRPDHGVGDVHPVRGMRKVAGISADLKVTSV